MNRGILKFIDHFAGPGICSMMSAICRESRNNPTSAPICPSSVKRLLVIRPGGIGDLVLLIPSLRALADKYPQAELDVICEKRNIDVLTLAGIKCNALTYDGNPISFLHRLRSRKYDIAVDSEQFHNFSAIFAFWSKAPVRIGFNINPRRNPLYTHLVSYDLNGHESAQFAGLLAPLGISDIKTCISSIDPVGITLSNSISKELDYLGQFCAINPCGSSVYKSWDSTHYVELIKRLNNDFGLSVVLLGGENESAICKQITDTARVDSCRAVSFAGRISLNDSAAVVAKAKLLIGVDSGLAHIAVAMDTPSVTLFASTNPSKWAFKDTSHAVVNNPLPCSPCAIFGYNKPCRTITCMSSISVESVVKAAKSII